MSNPRLLVGIALMLLAAGGALAYWFAWRGPDIIRLPVVEDCALQLQPCSSELPGGGTITFEINPRQPTPSDALLLSARFRQVEPTSVGARFKGINMNMGQLEYLVHELAPIDRSGDSIAYAGRGGVFACSAGVMQWLVLVRVQLGDAVYEVPFRFETRGITAPPGSQESGGTSFISKQAG